jgi:tripartite-type tricarboxylate transporter receptor subunit TctC
LVSRRAARALNALLADDVTMLFGSVPAVAELAKDGRLRALGVASGKRSSVMPDLPTLGELAFPGVEMDGWNGLIAPAGTLPAVIATLHAGVRRALAGDETQRPLGTR